MEFMELSLETNALDYPRAYIDPVRPRNRKSILYVLLYGNNAQAATPFNTRWRTITLETVLVT